MSNFYSAQLHDKVAYHDFEGITVHADEGPRLVRNIGDRPAVILRNHGLLAWARHGAARVRHAVDAEPRLRDPARVDGDGPGDRAFRRTSSASARAIRCSSIAKFGAGQDVFDALTRLIDRTDTSYRT